MDIPRQHEVVKIHNDIILRSPSTESFYDKIRMEFNGMTIFKEIRDKLILSHEAVSYWGKNFTKQVIEMDEEQTKTYLSGKDLILDDISELEEGTVVLRRNGVVVGKGLLRGLKVKNQLPREYVIV